MSYLVFARKYRPLTFDDVVGQQHITQTLAKALERDRVAHAYIFTGTRGVGKTTTARILARALNCDNGPTATPCGTCDTCKSIIAGSSFDVIEIDGASNNSVDDIRELRDNIGYSSMGGKYRVFVIDEVHMLSKAAFNALLKTLEEPPPRVIFIFATTEPHRIPATIHSRCQRYDFRRISTEQIRGQLEKICTSEGVTFDVEGLGMVARKADGSMRDALSLLDQVYSYCQGEIAVDDVRTVLGLVSSEVYATIMQAVKDHDPEPVLGAVRDVLYQGFDLHEFVVGLEEYIRDLLLAGLRGESADAAEGAAAQASVFDEATLLRMSDHVRKAENELRYSAFPRFLVETLLLKLVHMDDTVSLQTLLRMVGGDGADVPPAPEKKKILTETPAPQNAVSAPTPVPETAPPPVMVVEEGAPPMDDSSIPLPDAPPPEDPEEYEPPRSMPPQAEEPTFDDDRDSAQLKDLQAEWPAFLDALKAERPNLALFLSHGHIASFAGHTLDLRFAPTFKFQFDEVTKRENRGLVEKKLAAFAGGQIELHMTLENTKSDAGVQNYVEHMTGAQALSLEDDIQNEPIIKTVLEAFDGEILQ